MLFNSYAFIILFLPLALLCFHLIKSASLRKLSVIIFSLAFYSLWEIRDLNLLIISILFNYALGIILHNLLAQHSKLTLLTLIFAVTCNLLNLIIFKYSEFFFGIPLYKDAISSVAIPLAISFYTFEQICYLVDIYKGNKAEKNFLTYAFFITFFPRLIAGPIYYFREYKTLIEDACTIKKPDWLNISKGLTLFIFGLFKKVVIADRLALIAITIFDKSDWLILSFIDFWLGSLAYCLQIYFDFSGYSEMALGIGLMYGIKLPINFNSPYKSTSIIDFWSRWHMSLSRFIKDYLYIPLGGNRKGEVRQYCNIFLTMLIAGLWHGAGHGFVLWGGIYGLLISANHIIRRYQISFPRLLKMLVTFIIINFMWVIFRAESIEQSTYFITNMITWRENPFISTLSNFHISFILCLLASCFVLPNAVELTMNKDDFINKKISVIKAIFMSILFIIALLELSKISIFLYFNF